MTQEHHKNSPNRRAKRDTLMRVKSDRAYDDLNKRKQLFVDAYLKTADRLESLYAAGYKPTPRNARAQANKLYYELAPIIREEMDRRIGTGAVLALQVIRELMESATSETVKLAAAKDYLTRAGLDKPIKTELEVSDLRDKQDAELQSELAELLTKVISDPGPGKTGT